eukprot:TRINITY_DN782042_c0_g1_i1.p2 TRINITY_DN782042_c0_g1~~TRINITY_DN782042_c0_g1_i1.p2  ORF type:complete len:111 (+),score=25.78 TRINITY_DN782042_c0_g1_i1:746-1078(+)
MYQGLNHVVCFSDKKGTNVLGFDFMMRQRLVINALARTISQSDPTVPIFDKSDDDDFSESGDVGYSHRRIVFNLKINDMLPFEYAHGHDPVLDIDDVIEKLRRKKNSNSS